MTEPKIEVTLGDMYYGADSLTHEQEQRAVAALMSHIDKRERIRVTGFDLYCGTCDPAYYATCMSADDRDAQMLQHERDNPGHRLSRSIRTEPLR